MGRNYQLILRVPIIVTVPIGGFSGLSVGAVVEATPTSSFHFAGPVLVSVPIWIPTGFELDIGNLQAMVDLNALDNFSLGASVALTPGEELYDVFSFDGNLAVNMRESTVSFGGQLSVLRVPVSSVTGKWLIQEGVLRVDTTSIVGNLLPIPQSHVIVDGPGCAIVGTANAKLVGIELLQGSAVVLFPCTGNHTPIPDTAKLVLSCGSAGNLGRVCVTGQASLGNIAQAMTSFDSSLLTPSPHMRARINVLDISDVSVEASLAMVKLDARLLMIDLSVFLPSLENVNADDVRKLFENMLRPSINLQALLSGKIVISPTSGSGNGEGMSDGDGNGGGTSNGGGGGGGGGDGDGANPSSAGANGSPSTGTASPVITSAPGSGTLDIEPVKGWSGAVQLVYKSGSFTGPYYWDGSVILRASDEGQKFRNHLLFPIPNSAKGVLSNGRPYILACDSNPCNDVTISLVPLLKPPDETAFSDQTRHLGNLTGGASVALISKGFLVAPQLANYLAARVYEGKNVPAMQCLPEQSAGCNSVLLRDSTAARPWATRYVCWGAGIVDLDNDGYPDLFVTTGNVYPEVERKLPQFPNKSPRAVYRNLGDRTFEELGQEAGPGVTDAHCSRGCAFGDFDNDGDVDILIVNLNESPSLLRNDMKQKQNWIKVKLEGVKSNRSAIGARVVAHYGGKAQAQAVLSQSSFYSCSDSRLHFGLGGFNAVDLDIYWPNGLHEQYKKILANQLITLREGSGIISNKGWARA